MGGTDIFLYQAWFDTEGWNGSFYVWMCIGQLLNFALVCTVSRDLLKAFYPVFVYTVFRLWTEIQIAIWPNQDINAEYTVSLLALLALLVTTHLIDTLTQNLIRLWYSVR